MVNQRGEPIANATYRGLEEVAAYRVERAPGLERPIAAAGPARMPTAAPKIA